MKCFRFEKKKYQLLGAASQWDIQIVSYCFRGGTRERRRLPLGGHRHGANKRKICNLFHISRDFCFFPFVFGAPKKFMPRKGYGKNKKNLIFYAFMSHEALKTSSNVPQKKVKHLMQFLGSETFEGKIYRLRNLCVSFLGSLLFGEV